MRSRDLKASCLGVLWWPLHAVRLFSLSGGQAYPPQIRTSGPSPPETGSAGGSFTAV